MKTEPVKIRNLREGIMCVAQRNILLNYSWGWFANCQFASSVEYTDLFHGPIAKDGFAIDVGTRDRPEIAAVVGHASVVAKNKIAVQRHLDLRIRPGIQILLRNVGFLNETPIQVNVAVKYADTVPRQSNYTLDEALARIARIAEHNNIAALDVLQAVCQFVDENALLVLQARLHTAAFHLDRLVDEEDDEQRDGDREN